MDLERKPLRLPVESRVYIELEGATGEYAANGDEGIAICKTLDVSAQGLRVALDHELEEQAYLQVGVEPPHGDHPAEPFFLIAQVRWCRPGDTPDQPFIAGLALMPARGSDIDRWIALISDLAD